MSGALAEAGRLMALAGAVLDADDATLYARLTALAEAPTDSAAPARDRQETATIDTARTK